MGQTEEAGTNRSDIRDKDDGVFRTEYTMLRGQNDHRSYSGNLV